MYCTFASACAAVCVQCTYLPYITHTLRFVVCACFCLLSLCFVFNPFQTKMLRFDFIFLSFCFHIFAAYFAAHFEASGTFSPAALNTHTCIIYNMYCIYCIHIFNILASKISYYPHAVCVGVSECGLLLYVHVNFICFLRAHKSKKIVFYTLIRGIYVCAPFSTLGYSIFYSIFVPYTRAIFLYAFAARPFCVLVVVVFSAFFSVFGKRVARREFVLICAQKLFNKNADNGTVN